MWLTIKCDKCDEEFDVQVEGSRQEYIDKVYSGAETLKCNKGHYLDWHAIQ